MKIRIILLLLVTLQGYTQISVGPRHVGTSKKFAKGVLEKFKKTETIFILSNIYDRDEYEKVLNDSWDVTPYKIIAIEDFDIENYLSDNYSIAQLGGFKKTTEYRRGITTESIISSLYTYVDIKMYDSDKILKKLNKLSPKKRKKDKESIIRKNSSNIARFYIYPKDDFLYTFLSEDMDKIFVSLYTEDVFFNYKLGFLKNYFQKINNLIKNEEIYWMFKSDFLPELKKLSKNTLYIPSFMTIKFNGWKGKDSEPDDDNIDELFKKYDYQYEIISDQDLSARILDNQEFYYLRYVRMNAERFLQVVNSKTGEIIYRKYIPGLSYKIKLKHIKDLNSKIKKANNK